MGGGRNPENPKTLKLTYGKQDQRVLFQVLRVLRVFAPDHLTADPERTGRTPHFPRYLPGAAPNLAASADARSAIRRLGACTPAPIAACAAGGSPSPAAPERSTCSTLPSSTTCPSTNATARSSASIANEGSCTTAITVHPAE